VNFTQAVSFRIPFTDRLLVALIMQTAFSSVTFLHDNATTVHSVRQFDKSRRSEAEVSRSAFFLLPLKTEHEVCRLRRPNGLREAWPCFVKQGFEQRRSSLSGRCVPERKLFVLSCAVLEREKTSLNLENFLHVTYSGPKK